MTTNTRQFKGGQQLWLVDVERGNVAPVKVTGIACSVDEKTHVNWNDSSWARGSGPFYSVAVEESYSFSRTQGIRYTGAGYVFTSEVLFDSALQAWNRLLEKLRLKEISVRNELNKLTDQLIPMVEATLSKFVQEEYSDFEIGKSYWLIDLRDLRCDPYKAVLASIDRGDYDNRPFSFVECKFNDTRWASSKEIFTTREEAVKALRKAWTANYKERLAQLEESKDE